MKKRGERVNKGVEEDGRKEKKRKGKWREMVEEEEATLVQTELKKQQSAAYHFQVQFLWIFCLCFNIFYLNAFFFFLILLLLSLLCACLYISVVLFYRWLITPASSSPCVHWASLSVYAHPRFSSCISVFLSCTLLYSPWILQVFFLFLDFNVVVFLFLSFFVKYLQICIFLLKILDILHLFAFIPVVPMSVGAVLH